MNPVHLDTLLTIVEEGSFEYAAAVLGITPSAVSQRIKALETSTGRVLLRRGTPVTATEAGEVLVQAARRMALVRAEANARLSARLSRVPLTVAINHDSLCTWFRQVIKDCALRGNVALHLKIQDEAHTLQMLRRGDVLGAITREDKPVSGCESTYVGTVRYRAVAAPWLAAEFDSWQTMPVVSLGVNDVVLEEAMHARSIDTRVLRAQISRLPSSESYLHAVRYGMGWGLVTELQAQALIDAGELALLDDDPMDIDLYWQRWRLESEVLAELTRAVLDASSELRAQ